MHPIVEPQEFQPIIQPKVLSDGSEYNMPEQWTFNPHTGHFSYSQWIYEPKTLIFRY
jgi:hypothetical protein